MTTDSDRMIRILLNKSAGTCQLQRASATCRSCGTQQQVARPPPVRNFFNLFCMNNAGG